MSGLLLDADVLIDLFQRHPDALEWFASLQETPSVSCFAALEVLAGSRTKRERAEVARLLNDFPLVYPLPSDIDRALLEYSPFSLSHGVGVVDTLTASLAVGNGLTLVSRNAKHFLILLGSSLLVPYKR